jgi:membrane-bound lytic murein transglycosylase A
VPLYRRPPDLVHMGSKRRVSMPNKGRVMRRINWRTFVPYHDRAAIEDGILDGRHLEICYLRSWTDVLFMQIQGSARIRLEDGEVLRVNYDSHNGQPGVSVGRVLIERDLVSRDEMSMDRIRAWMEKHPREAAEVRRLNKSFTFFRITGLSQFDEAAGAQGVPLTPVRSIAVDRALHVYGTPFFIEADLPIASDAPTTKFRRLLIAQDTGSAIVGPARADIYFGAGDEAGRIAGRIKQRGRFTMLLPRELDLVEAGKEMPLPAERPTEAIDKSTDKPAEALPASQPIPPPVPLPPERPLEAYQPLPGPVPVPQPKPK